MRRITAFVFGGWSRPASLRWLTSGEVQAVFRECGLHVEVMKTQLYEVALAHPSSSGGSIGIVEGENQRQEFLGDAVIGLASALYAFQKFPNAHEGTLTNVRASLVQRQTLSNFSRRLGIDNLLPAVCPRNDRVLADAFESFVAARFLDVMGSTGGDVGEAFNEARAFVLAVFTTFDDFETPAVNYKGRLNDICLQAGRVTPEYVKVSQDLTTFNTVYVCEVHATPFDVVAVGSGPTVKAAHQAAAREALLIINENHPDFSTPGLLPRQQ